ncbi:outer membrane lipoprotein chaperone LolA [Pasteurella skyensis]|uniref:Outer-membrane lipoprotein carrier protein n=1 Tax=Phocoenobacter skyensis TaxID=97481 RepID=A0AAJ6P0V7_9PAST|nr:outer membrane lipoprotein chaperone LolA [Pasteurella skyensis]MDP8163092.1 outer membrane lipoprotein chaperone LolA [Pasteurella skyensis]MDP8173087.1 outer membrane lipoprotein chaperone LolA [Pasteurella skyensis]MDP8177185.1 outer membrane lipoprotein chaperone LolA [Pasteurella skyensis]MDP8179649.1 outer membrane lipoprotein chaperone LolA [Pasteurella skyensis]MDP8183838.1 outer membrane lipoprotein chaperone LolA [Pasteurella skyensis]
MKKSLIKTLVCVSIVFFSSAVFANSQAVVELQKRLGLVSQYKTDFVQTVRSMKGKVIQEGEGIFRVKRPNLFRMEQKKPQESLVISDGETLWFYDPFVYQVTANWTDDIVNNTPFVLLTSNKKDYWNQYDVTQDSDTFVLKPKAKNSNIQQFDIRINSHGLLKGFSTIEKNGHSNLYILRNISTAEIDPNLFNFVIPKGAELDDQRTKK